MSQIRSFLAIDLDDDFKPKVNKIIKEFKKIDANIKFVDLNNLHFTLKFFGDIDTEGIDLISKKIEKVADDFEPFNIKISGCGAFPNNNHIKVIWIGVESDEFLVQLHDKLDEEFAAIGFDKDKKFSNDFKYYDYNIEETITENNAVVCFKAKNTNSSIKKRTYGLEKRQNRWVVIYIDYLK